MRKLVMYICLILTVICLGGCGNNKATDNVEIKISESQYYSEDEIQEAINLVKKKFNFTDCTLTKLWYEEEKAEQMKEGYIHYGKGLNNGIKAENVIVIFSEFKVDESGKNPVLSPGATYSDYSWTLIRSNKNSQWAIDDQGY